MRPRVLRWRPHARHAGVAFASVDIDEAEDLVEAYSVSAVPHFVMLGEGAKQDYELVVAQEEQIDFISDELLEQCIDVAEAELERLWQAAEASGDYERWQQLDTA